MHVTLIQRYRTNTTLPRLSAVWLQEGDPLLKSIKIDGSALSGGDIAVSQVGPLVLPSVFLPSVTADDGTQGADVTAVCRSTRRLICTADEKGGKGTFSKSCISANKMSCHEVLSPPEDLNNRVDPIVVCVLGVPACSFLQVE